MKRSNLRIIEIEDGKESQLKGPENIFDKIIDENLPNLKNEMAINVQEAFRTPNRLEQIRNKQTYQNYTRLINRDSKSQKILGRCHRDTKRTQMPTQANIPSKNLNYHRWRNQDIP